MRRFSTLLLFTSVVTAFAVSGDAIEVAFFPDDPMSVFPEPADASLDAWIERAVFALRSVLGAPRGADQARGGSAG